MLPISALNRQRVVPPIPTGKSLDTTLSMANINTSPDMQSEFPQHKPINAWTDTHEHSEPQTTEKASHDDSSHSHSTEQKEAKGRKQETEGEKDRSPTESIDEIKPVPENQTTHTSTPKTKPKSQTIPDTQQKLKAPAKANIKPDESHQPSETGVVSTQSHQRSQEVEGSSRSGEPDIDMFFNTQISEIQRDNHRGITFYIVLAPDCKMAEKDTLFMCIGERPCSRHELERARYVYKTSYYLYILFSSPNIYIYISFISATSSTVLIAES